MKKMVALVLSVIMVLGLAACGDGGSEDSKSTTAAKNDVEQETVQSDGETPDVIKIGVVCAISGTYAQEGEYVKEAIDLLKEELDAAGGVEWNGTKIPVEFIYEDNEGDAETSVNCFNKLIDNEGVMAIIGPPMSGCLIAAGPIAQENQVPTIGTMTTNIKCTQVGDYIFRACFIDNFQAKVAANWMMSEGYTEVAILSNNADDYSTGMGDEFETQFKALGGTILDRETYADAGGGDVKDFSVQLTKLKNAEPQAIFAPAYYMNVPDILAQATQIGLNVPILGTDSWDTPDVLSLIDPANKSDVYYISAYSALNPDEKVQEFSKKFNEAYGKTPNSNGTFAYDAAALVVQAISEAETLDGPGLRNAMAAIDYNGVTGSTTFDENRNPIKDANILKFVGNEVEFVTTVKASDLAD
ncbi:MAG: ABC transporter substrate-binding protein [Lachnospiraceae bacterium]|jgi:branched-chain amino acid transport system substrate-binding protein|nr:ABC transporter substrate-binding protein [Lachnospiraceae bacterium]